MARIRTIKPDFFLDHELAQCSIFARLFFIGLWTQADIDGRLKDDPEKLKVQILPWDQVDINTLLNELHPKFIIRYAVNLAKYIQIRTWKSHQRINGSEAHTGSIYPAPSPSESRQKDNFGSIKDEFGSTKDESGHLEGKGREGKGREGKGKDDVAAGATATKEPTEYQRAVEHIIASYALGPGKGTKYPFAGKDGRAVKRLLGLYGFPDLMALWDEFLVTKWDWVNSMNKTVTVPRNLQVFESKLTDLIERGSYKKRLYSQDEKEGAKPGIQSIGKVLGSVVGGLH